MVGNVYQYCNPMDYEYFGRFPPYIGCKHEKNLLSLAIFFLGKNDAKNQHACQQYYRQ